MEGALKSVDIILNMKIYVNNIYVTGHIYIMPLYTYISID